METSTVKGPARTICKWDDSWGKGMFDGGIVDTQGYLWWALNGAGKVVRIDPKNGECVKIIEFDAPMPTSVAFGGPDMKTLLVTFIGEIPPMPPTKAYPNGCIALVGFDDDTIQGPPLNKLNHDLVIKKGEAQSLEINIDAGK